MDILKSFEVFLSEPLSVLKNSLVQIVGITTGNTPKVTADLLKRKTQITVENSEKMYNLLKRVNSKPTSLRKRSGLFGISKEEPPKAVFGQLTLRI